MEFFKGLLLNELGDPRPWGPQEKANFKYLRSLIESTDEELSALETTVTSHTHFSLVKEGGSTVGLTVDPDFTRIVDNLIVGWTPEAEWTPSGMLDLKIGYSDAYALLRGNTYFTHNITDYEEGDVAVSMRPAVGGSGCEAGGLKLRSITESNFYPAFVLDAIADAITGNVGYDDFAPLCKFVASVKATNSNELINLVGEDKILFAWYNFDTIVMALMADGRLVLGNPEDGPAWGFKYSGSDFHVTHKPNAGTGWVSTGFLDCTYSA